MLRCQCEPATALRQARLQILQLAVSLCQLIFQLFQIRRAVLKLILHVGERLVPIAELLLKIR